MTLIFLKESQRLNDVHEVEHERGTMGRVVERGKDSRKVRAGVFAAGCVCVTFHVSSFAEGMTRLAKAENSASGLVMQMRRQQQHQ